MLDQKQKLKADIEQAFDTQLTSNEFTQRQLWALVKLCKFVRLRARNNLAFNNLFNNLFPYASFTTVTKKRQDGSTYPGLNITVKGQESSDVDEQDDLD